MWPALVSENPVNVTNPPWESNEINRQEKKKEKNKKSGSGFLVLYPTTLFEYRQSGLGASSDQPRLNRDYSLCVCLRSLERSPTDQSSLCFFRLELNVRAYAPQLDIFLLLLFPLPSFALSLTQTRHSSRFFPERGVAGCEIKKSNWNQREPVPTPRTQERKKEQLPAEIGCRFFFPHSWVSRLDGYYSTLVAL